MPSARTLLGIAVLTSTLIAAAAGPSRAGDEPKPAAQDAGAQPLSVAVLGAGHDDVQLGAAIPTEDQLATGDGQPSSILVKPIDCADGNAICAP